MSVQYTLSLLSGVLMEAFYRELQKGKWSEDQLWLRRVWAIALPINRYRGDTLFPVKE